MGIIQWTSPYEILFINYGSSLSFSGKIQRFGFGYKFGATIGYEKKISDRLMLDLFVGGGWHQGYYHGYYNDGTPGRYEKAENWNISGEWLPYRGGLMISYRLN